MTLIDDVLIGTLLLGEQAVDPASPAATRQRLYVRTSDHHLVLKNAAGVVTDLQAGGGGGGGGGAVVRADHQTPSGVTNVTLTPLGTGTHLRIVAQALGSDAASNQPLNAQFNGDVGANYDRFREFLNASAPDSGSPANFIQAALVTSVGSTANYATAIVIDIPNYRATTFYKQLQARSTLLAGAIGTATIFDVQGFGWWRNTAAITSITLTLAAGNFAAGTVFDLYEYGSGGGGAPSYLLYQEQQTSGTSAGAFNSGSWVTRALNTEVADPDNIGSLATNQITLPAGTYEINAWACAHNVSTNKLRWQNITDSATVMYGSSNYQPSGTPDGDGIAVLCGRFTITGTKIFELQHQCGTTHATDGLGTASGFGTEIYSSVELRKVA